MSVSTPPQSSRSAPIPKASRRERRRSQLQTEQRRSTLIWVLLGTAALGFFGFLLFRAIRPAGGEAVPILPNLPHIPQPTPPGPYNTNPPTSGLHYAQTLPGGFYDEAEAAAVGPFPEGFLVHNLEHDYTIFWYNCQILSESECAELKAEIQGLFSSLEGFKLIAFPWPTMSESLVLTHWGRTLSMPRFDAGAAGQFIRTNLGRSPEPNAP